MEIYQINGEKIVTYQGPSMGSMQPRSEMEAVAVLNGIYHKMTLKPEVVTIKGNHIKAVFVGYVPPCPKDATEEQKNNYQNTITKLNGEVNKSASLIMRAFKCRGTFIPQLKLEERVN